MIDFCKNENCHASQELLDFQTGDLPHDRSMAVIRHLTSCEFCAAEVELYSRYPQTHEDAISEIAQIPAPLFELAEALLKNRHTDSSSLESLLRGNDRYALNRN